MKYGWVILAALVCFFPLAAGAQKDAAAAAPNDPAVLGRRLFQQNCSVCHTQTTSTNPMYGPSLYRDIVNGREEAIRDYIGKGSNKMPGFRYGLTTSQISAIVEYLKTVPKPAPRSLQKGEDRVD